MKVSTASLPTNKSNSKQKPKEEILKKGNIHTLFNDKFMHVFYQGL